MVGGGEYFPEEASMRSVRWTIPGFTLLLLGGGNARAAVAVQEGTQIIQDMAILRRDNIR